MCRQASLLQQPGESATPGAEDFGRMIRDQFDVLYEEGKTRPRVMSISLHPFISGHPFRMKHIAPALEYIASHAGIWRATGGEINDWYRNNYLNK